MRFLPFFICLKRGHWNPCFSRLLNDWEVDKVNDLFPMLQGKVDSVRKDKMMRMNLNNNKFFVKHIYVALELRVLISFLKRVVWNSWVPSKVNFFAWEATLGKVLTISQLKKRM